MSVQVLHNCHLLQWKMEVCNYHTARLLKEESSEPEVLGIQLIRKRERLRNHSQEREARSGVGGDTHRRMAQWAAPCLSPGRMLKAFADRPADLPCKPACVQEKRKPKDKGLEKRGEWRKWEKRTQNCFQKLFIFKHDSTFFEYEMNRTDRFLLKSFAAPRSPTMHPKLGKSGLHGPRASPSPLSPPGPAGLTSPRPRRPRAPVQLPAGGPEGSEPVRASL